MDTVGKQVRQHWYGMLVACLVCILIGSGLALIYGRAQTDYWIVFGGNTDPGDGNGGGSARGGFVNGGWVDNDHIFQVTWQADIGQGTQRETDAAMPAGKAAYASHCGKAQYHCIIAGFSLGNDPAIQLHQQLGLAPDQLKMFGAPQPSSGIWHNPYPDNPFVEPFISTFGGIDTNRSVPAGSSAYYNTRDPYANGGPSCGGPGLFLLSLDGHYIISAEEAAGSHIWTGPDGVIMHEVGYQPAPNGLPRSGSDPTQPWDFCPPKFPDHIPMAPGDPGVPAQLQVPGFPR